MQQEIHIQLYEPEPMKSERNIISSHRMVMPSKRSLCSKSPSVSKSPVLRKKSPNYNLQTKRSVNKVLS